VISENLFLIEGKWGHDHNVKVGLVSESVMGSIVPAKPVQTEASCIFYSCFLFFPYGLEC
jgi:hypothetical protein